MIVNPPRAHIQGNGQVTVCPTTSGKRLELITAGHEIDGSVTISIRGERDGELGTIRVHVDTLRQALLLSGIGTARSKEPEVLPTSANAPLLGRRIVKVRKMTKAESAFDSWEPTAFGEPTCLELDDGSIIYPSQDPEDTGPGALFGQKDGRGYLWHAGRDEFKEEIA